MNDAASVWLRARCNIIPVCVCVNKCRAASVRDVFTNRPLGSHRIAAAAVTALCSLHSSHKSVKQKSPDPSPSHTHTNTQQQRNWLDLNNNLFIAQCVRYKCEFYKRLWCAHILAVRPVNTHARTLFGCARCLFPSLPPSLSLPHSAPSGAAPQPI